jgi:hypothetical protein
MNQDNTQPKDQEPCYYDECGNEIMEGDLLRVYHFRHYKRRKLCYMYHVAILVDDRGKLYWQGKEYHRNENKGHYNLRAVADPKTRVIHGTQIIDSKDAMRELSQTKKNKP